MLRRLTLSACAAAMAVLTPPAACAGALRVSPVMLDLPAGQAAAALTLRNDDETAMNIQVRVYRWTQVDGEDRLTPTEDVVVSPPIGPLAAHSERIVRVVRVATAPAGEEDYRLIVDELPPPADNSARQVRLLMRHSIPLFFGSAAATPKVVWTASAQDDSVTLSGANPGGRRLRVSNLRLLDPSGATVAARGGLVGYVLAGAKVSWRLPDLATAPERVVRLMADTDSGPLDVALAQAP